MTNLDRCCQLHEQIEVHYYVDNYGASIWTGDGCKKVIEAEGESVEEALRNLDKLCEGKDWHWEDWWTRGRRGYTYKAK